MSIKKMIGILMIASIPTTMFGGLVYNQGIYVAIGVVLVLALFCAFLWVAFELIDNN